MGARPPLAVSVVIPAYNQGEYLAEATASVLGQTLQQAVEVIVVDDGSTDDTPQVAAAFAGRITYIRQANRGVSEARNTGIRAAGAPLIKFLDSDDALEPRCLEVGWEAAKQHPHVSLFTGSWDDMDVASNTIEHCEAPPLPADAFHALFDCKFVGPPTRYFVRRAAFESVGVFDPALAGCEAWDLWFRMAAADMRFMTLPDAVVRYRYTDHTASTSKKYDLMWRTGVVVLNRAARAHGNCDACLRAKRHGLIRWRDWCYQSMLAPHLRAHWAHGRYGKLAVLSAAAAVNDPHVLRLLLKSASSR